MYLCHKTLGYLNMWHKNHRLTKPTKLHVRPEKTDQPGHPPNLIRVFAVHMKHPPSLIRVFPDRMKKAVVLSYPLSSEQRFWPDWADAQAHLNLPWAHIYFIDFVMTWLMEYIYTVPALEAHVGLKLLIWIRLIMICYIVPLRPSGLSDQIAFSNSESDVVWRVSTLPPS